MAARIKLNGGTGYIAVGVGGLRTTVTYPFTVASGFSSALFVSTHGNSTSPTSATFNGIALTNMSALVYNAVNSSQFWVLLNPPVGTYDITFTYSSNQSSGFTAVCLDGVDQTSAVLDNPHQTTASNGANPNEMSWCGDLPNSGVNRPMYMLTFGWANASVPSFIYDTSFDFFLAFSSRSNVTNEFTITETNFGGDGIGVAGFGRLAQGASWKTSVSHFWGGIAPTNSTGFLFINETLLDEPTVQMIII